MTSCAHKFGNQELKLSCQAISLVCLAVALLLIAGCGQNEVKLDADQKRAFDGATAEVKTMWAKALAADQANDYTNAQNLLDSLRALNLTSQQSHALDTELAAFQQRLWQTAEKGDPVATKAVLAINQTKNRR